MGLILPALLIVAFAAMWLLWPEPLARAMLALERRRSGMQSRRCRAAEIDWHYIEGGYGEPLVLLHGFNADANHFVRMARHLGPHFRIYAPDIPGFGETRVTADLDFRIEAQAERVLSWLDALGIERFHIGGNSMGGYLAAAIARHSPPRVRALWLLAPGGLHDAPYSPVFDDIEAGRHNPLIIRDRADFRRLQQLCIVQPVSVPGPVQRLLAARGAATRDQAEKIFHAMRFESTPLEQIAHDLNMPTLIVWGEGDRVLNPEGADLLEKLMPNARTVRMPATGHLPMLERPRRTAEIWMSFTRSLAEGD